MTSTVRNPCGLTLHDVSIQTKTKTIVGLMKQVLPAKVYININPGKNYSKNGIEMHRVYINLDKVESVDLLMRNRSVWCPKTEQWRIIRTLPKYIPLYDRCVTGLKIRIDQSSAGNLNELDLRNQFRHFGRIRHCQWINDDRTEALFTFDDYDSVDQILLTYPSLQIKGNQINLEKARTANDMTTYERSYMIHVKNLPLRITSEEVSSVFEVPIVRILLYPCFGLEQSRVLGGRSSSEAWIKNFSDEKTAQILSQKKNGIIVGKNRIECQAMSETIYEEELCERFQIGQCSYTNGTCFYKHFSCSLPDTCDDEYCWLGHNDQRKTVPVKRPEFRSENARYRLQLSNLPSDITHERLAIRLNIPQRFSQYIILEPNDENSTSPRMAYFIRQQLENRLRQLIDKCHGTSFSPVLTQHIQCQLEVNQEFYRWNDSTEITQSADNSAYASPALSTRSTCPNRTHREPFHPSAISNIGWGPNPTKTRHTIKPVQVPQSVTTDQSTIPKAKQPTPNSFKSKSVPTIRSSPSDWSNLTGRSFWSKEMITNDPVDSDQFYWIEDEPNKEKNVLAKIYSPKTDQKARIRALRERAALEQLTRLSSVPKLIQSNFDLSENSTSKKEFWTIMKFIPGERLFDYMKSNKVDFREALQITRELLNLIKEIHQKNVVHRDIQPKNILIQKRPNDQTSNFMFINFGSAFVINNNNNQWEDFNDHLGNQFYRMPQFEHRTDQTKPFEQSPTIDTTGICAILFWILTGHEPKESKDIWEKSPHHSHNHSKTIQTRIHQVIAFRMETGIYEHLNRHLMLIFDRAFDNPEQQWSVDQLDYQLQFLIALIDDDQLPLNENTTDRISLSPSIPLDDPFVYLVSLIHHLKHHFIQQYSQKVRWSTNENNHWSSNDGIIEHKHLLIFNDKKKNLSIDIHWNIKILQNHHFNISIQAKDQKNIHIQLPMGRYAINEQTNQFCFQTFQLEIKTLIHILCKLMTS